MCFSPLCTVRLLYFVWFGATICLIPFLPLHMKAIGVPLWHSTVLSGIVPLLQIVTCVLASFVPQCSPSYRKSTQWGLLFTAVSALLLVFTPRVPIPTDKGISMTFQCGAETEPSIAVDKCNHQCEDDESLSSSGIEVFFTECHVDCPGLSGDFMNNADLCFDHGPSRICHVVEVNNTLSENFIFNLHLEKGSEMDDDKCRHVIRGVTWQQRRYHRVSCSIIMTQKTNSKCVLKCGLMEISSKISGIQSCLRDSSSAVNYAIYVYVGLRIIFHVCIGISSPLIERALVCFLKKERRKVRHYSVWSHISSYMIAPLAGLLIDNHPPDDIIFNYKLLFVVFFALVLISMVFVSSIEIEGTTFTPVKDILKVLPLILKESKPYLLLIVALILGAANGYLDTFLFWHLQDMSCPYYIMGLTITIGLVFGLPFMCTRLPSVLKTKISSGYLLSLCLLLQCLRCLGYYFINNFWWCLLMESFGNLAFLITWTAMSGYARKVIPEERREQFHGIIGAWHYGLGKSCGILIGGSLATLYGFRLAFLGFASALGFTACLYAIYYNFELRKLRRDRISITSDEESKAEDERKATLLQSLPATKSEDNALASSAEDKFITDNDSTDL